MGTAGKLSQAAADRLHQLWEAGKIIEVEVLNTSKHGNILCWEVDLGGGYTGIIPEPESAAEGHMPQYVGTAIYAKILEIDHENKKVALSRKAAVEYMRQRVLQRIKPGDQMDAVIRYVEPDAVYVDIGGVPAKMPRVNATISRSARLRNIFRAGQKIKVQVVELEPEIVVDRASLMADPWLTATFSRKDIVSGTVVAFAAGDRPSIEVREGLTGIAPMPLSFTVQRRQKVRCQVVRFDRERRRLHLRILDVILWQ